MTIKEYIEKLKEGFPEYNFEIQPPNSGYSRVFVKYNGVALGRLSFKGDEFTHHKFYKKPDYEYESRDAFFYLYDYYIKTGKLIDLDRLVPIAKTQRNERITEIIEARAANPKYDKEGNLRARKRISSDWMPFFRRLISEEMYYGRNIS